MSLSKEKQNQPGEAWLTAGLILLVSALAFLPLAGKLGYYHDDWFTTISRVTGTPLTVMHSVDRPGMGVLYQFVAGILGEAPLAWHIFAWAARAAGGLAFLWLGRLLWPRQKLATALMAVLYVVYPGFLQQTSANNYQNHLLAYSASILSLALTAKAIRSQRWSARILLSLAALVLAYGYPRVYEAMIGMEGLRFILIWYQLMGERTHQFWKRLRESLLWFVPFLLNGLYFVYWRLYKFQSLRWTVDADSLLDQYRYNLIGTILRIGTGILKDFYETVLAAWFVPLYQLGLNARYRTLFLGGGLALVIFVLILAYSRLMRRENPEEPHPSSDWARDAAVIGCLGVLVTLLPVAFSGRDAQFQNYLDRYTIQSMVPTAMLLVGVIWLAVKANYQVHILAGLAGLAVCAHLFNAAGYAANWEMQRQVWWQFSWRAPQIQPGTALIVQMPNIYRYPEGFEVWAPANRIYYPQANPPAITAEVLNADTLQEVLSGEVVERNFRLIEFEIDYSKTLVLSMPSMDSCLHVLKDGFELSQWDTEITCQAAVRSRVEQILTEREEHVPPAVIFGREPAHEWCYYYQKADLARQRGDWQDVVQLGEEAAQQGFFPDDPVEWVPFFEAFLHLERLEDASRLAEKILETPAVAENLCNKYLPLSTTLGRDASRLLCGIP